MKTLLTTVAGAALIAGAVIAQNAGEMSRMNRASDLMDNDVYSTGAYADGDWSLDAQVDDIEMRYTNIGEIEDLVIDQDGRVMGVVAEIGGFLDVGDRHVMLPMDDVRIVRSGGEAHYVTRLTEEQLEQREALDDDWWS